MPGTPEHQGQHPSDRLLTHCRGVQFPLPSHLFEGLKPLFCNPIKNFPSLESKVLVAEMA